MLGEEDDAQAAVAGRKAVEHLGTQWGNLAPLVQAQQAYAQGHGGSEDVDTRNKAQHALRQQFTPFFTALHASLKQLDKAIREMDKRKAAGKRGGGNRQTKGVRDTVQALHDEVTGHRFSCLPMRRDSHATMATASTCTACSSSALAHACLSSPARSSSTVCWMP